MQVMPRVNALPYKREDKPDIEARAAKRMLDVVNEVVYSEPFFAGMLMRMERVPDWSIPTMMTNGIELRYNPYWVADMLSFPEVVGVAKHECMHVALDHPFRRENRDHRLWNRAGDAVINQVLIEANVTLPKNGVFDDRAKGKATDEMYKLYKDEEPEPEPFGYPEPQEGDSEQDDDELDLDMDESDGEADEDAPKRTGKGKSPKGKHTKKVDDDDADGETEGDDDDDWDDESDEDDDAADGEDAEGVDADGEDEDEEDGDEGEGDAEGDGEGDEDENPDGDATPGDGDMGTVEDCPVSDPGELAALAEKNRTETVLALNVAKAQGCMPAGIERLVKGEAFRPSKTADVIRKYLTESARKDWTLRHPNKVHAQRGIYMKTLHAEGDGGIVIAIDTSGSVSPPLLGTFVTEMTSLTADLGVPVTVIYCDHEVEAVETYAAGEVARDPKPKGGGGTSYQPVFDWVKENMNDNIVALVYATDTECDDVVEEPPFPLIWVYPQESRGGYYGTRQYPTPQFNPLKVGIEVPIVDDSVTLKY